MTHHHQTNEPQENFQQESWREGDPPRGFEDLLELIAEHGFGGMA